MIPCTSSALERDISERGLTEREADAARSVLLGMTAERAAKLMDVGPSTVSSYRQRAYRKLGVATAHDLRSRYAGASRGLPCAQDEDAMSSGKVLRAGESEVGVSPPISIGVSGSDRSYWAAWLRILESRMPFASFCVASLFVILGSVRMLLGLGLTAATFLCWFLAALGFSACIAFMIRGYRALSKRRADELLALRNWKARVSGLLCSRGLNETQSNVASLIAEGKSGREIASSLCVSMGTVNSARRAVYRTLGVHSRSEFLEMLSHQILAPQAEVGSETPSGLRRARRCVLLALSMTLALALSAVSLRALSSLRAPGEEGPSIQSDYGQVPDVSGMEVSVGSDLLAKAGYYPRVSYVESDANPGKILALGPISGPESAGDAVHIADDGTRYGFWKAMVTIEVAELPTVPQVEGAALADALDTLDKAGFSNVSVDYSDGEDGGPYWVVGSEPAGHDHARHTDLITLRVRQFAVVPDVRGMDPLKATLSLSSAGLAPSPSVTSLSLGMGEVMPRALSTNPAPGTRARVGERVDVTYDREIG